MPAIGGGTTGSQATVWYKTGLLASAVIGLAGGAAAWGAGQDAMARLIWSLGMLPVLAALAVQIAISLAHREGGLDILAAASMTAALAVGEVLAGAVVAVMYAGGTFLEGYASGRARREMTALLERVPRHAARRGPGGIEEIALDAVRPGDRLLIRQGDIVPVDGIVGAGTAQLDMAALTGESLPVQLSEGQEAPSGAANAGQAFDLVALRPAGESTFAGIVRLVAVAQRAKAPMSRLADRWSVAFLAAAVALAGMAWGLTGDPIRAVAVLVVATPCPLILAVPIALVAGLSRAARYGVMVKGADKLEAMARVRTLILDKTGTLTQGQPQVMAITTTATLPAAEVLRLAASLDQASKHPMARALVAEARSRGLTLWDPRDVHEVAGEGLAGTVTGRAVVLGNANHVARATAAALPPDDRPAGIARVWVAADGCLVGTIDMGDPLRPDMAGLLARLRRDGIGRIVLATGDRDAVARQVTDGLGLDATHADLRPQDKLDLVRQERRIAPVMLVGDGVNDAPALAAADVGVAMGVRGAAAAAEAADVVLMVDRLDPLATGLGIARSARAIALQSVAVGIGLSLAGMVAAALGYLSPVQGALLQEVIDVAVILNALRVLRVAPGPAGKAGTSVGA